MTVKDIKGIISSATIVRLYVAKNKQDARNDKSQYVRLFHYGTNLSNTYERLEVAYIYPSGKDYLEVWAIED